MGSKHEECAEKLEMELHRHAGTALPSIAELARRYGAAPATMWRAVHLLQDRGLVRIRQGSGVWVPPVPAKDSTRTAAPPEASCRAGERFAAVLRHSLLNGIFTSGEPLPKVAYLCTRYGVSPTTVCNACTELKHEGIIHKRGKQWVAGSAAAPVVTDEERFYIGRNAPIVVIIMNNPQGWQRLNDSIRGGPLLRVLTGELEKHRIRLVHTHIDNPLMFVPALYRFDRLPTYLERLGDRYRGTHIISTAPAARPDLTPIFERLAAIGKPVVWAQHNDVHNQCTDRIEQAGTGFYRQQSSDLFMVRMALQALRDLGHRVIAVPFDPRVGWMPDRLALIRRSAGSMRSGPRIEPIDMTGDHSMMRECTRLIPEQEIIEAIAPGQRSPVPGSPALRRAFLKAVPSLAVLKREAAATAILGLNDYLSQKLYVWLNAVGLAVPRDCSLLSFDNRQEARVYPVSTIDMGFDTFGYILAHAFIGDIPLKYIRDQDFRNHPRLHDRGSLGPPGKEDG